MKEKKQVLVSPLNWGLGHATRITPVIRMLIEKGCDVVLAADGKAYEYFCQEFPDLPIYRLHGMNVNYAHRLPLWMKMLLQIPRIILGIYREHRGLQNIVKSRNIDLIISDNRYGLAHKTIPSVFVSHQLYIRMPSGFCFLQPVLFRITNYFIKQFTHHWVPDFSEEEGNTLSGKLSHPAVDGQTTYVGPLSRLSLSTEGPRYDFAVMLSGPEPQRTLFEKKIVESPLLRKYRVAVIRGMPECNQIPAYLHGVEVYNHLAAEPLSKILSNATFVICRPGYSTVMDLYVLNKPAVFIPTPGQTEQEYLARHLEGEAYTAFSQKDFMLERAIAAGENLLAPQRNQDHSTKQNRLEEAISEVIQIGQNDGT